MQVSTLKNGIYFFFEKYLMEKPVNVHAYAMLHCYWDTKDFHEYMKCLKT